MNLWIVGQADWNIVGKWDFQGVFDSEAAAIAACKYGNYFVAPATLNTILPHDPIEWVGLVWPLTSVPREKINEAWQDVGEPN